jgi:hypothetical protein
MKSTISLRICAVVAAGVVAINVANAYDLRPPFLRPALDVEVRSALGCIDDSGGKLLDDYRRTIYMSTDQEIDAVDKFFQLKSLTSDASIRIEEMQDCYETVAQATGGLDSDGSIRASLETMGAAYQGIFLGEATSISKAIREKVGIVREDDKSPVAVVPKSELFIKTAEQSFATMSARIGSIVTR